MLFLDKFEIDNALLVFPKFPIPSNPVIKHHELPIGLLKIGSYLDAQNVNVYIVNKTLNQKYPDNFMPDIIIVSTLFSYYAPYVKETIDELRLLYSNIPIICGGIWASLNPQKCKEYTNCDYVHYGIIPEVETIPLNYSLLQNKVDFQILHTSRGCSKHCKYCGTYQIEPNLLFKDSIKYEIKRKKIVIYDNNILLNPNFDKILDEFLNLKKKHMISSVLCVSGLDKQLLIQNPEYAFKMKKASFIKPYIAWDESIDNKDTIKKTVDILTSAGYKPYQIGCYMLFNYNIPFEECEQKRIFLYQLGVRPAPCRFRPYTQLYDNYNHRKQQTNNDYYIHPFWTDSLVKAFITNCSRHIACLYSKMDFYSKSLNDKKQFSFEEYNKYKTLKYEDAVKIFNDCWNPNDINGGLKYDAIT